MVRFFFIMICTLIENSNWTKEIQYGQQHLAKVRGVEYFTYKDLTEAEIRRIRDAKAEDVQKILSELF